MFPLKFFTTRNQTAQVPRFDEENREPCENHGLSRNCNHQKGFATDVHCSKDGKDGKNGESQDTCLCGLTMLSRNKAKVRLISPVEIRGS